MEDDDDMAELMNLYSNSEQPSLEEADLASDIRKGVESTGQKIGSMAQQGSCVYDTPDGVFSTVMKGFEKE